MKYRALLEVAKSKILEVQILLKAWLAKDRRRIPILISIAILLLLYACSRGEEKMQYIYEGPEKRFSQARVLENPYRHIADNKIDLLEESEERLRRESREIQRQISDMRSMLEELKSSIESPKAKTETPSSANAPAKGPEESPKSVGGEFSNVEMHNEQGPEPLELNSPGPVEKKPVVSRQPNILGPSSITFPVGLKREDRSTGVVIPSGSYVKAKIVSGVKVPVGETYPASLQLDYAFIAPNNFKVNLSGCLVVAKAEADLSTERVNMSPHSIRCYSDKRIVFKRDNLVGWASDSMDNNFGLKAEVNLNQGRLAQTAFAKSLIEGVGSSLERNTRSMGGKGIDDASPDLVIKDSGQKTGGMMTDYYMDYLKGLRPTLNVSSGRDAWIVLGTDIELPSEHFTTEESNEVKPNSGVDIFN